ncbi:hypothetical protein H257_08467 [Aphanomyces astaci]|uniref:Chromo domain-containing protein n=1 Tax=Aphanomyces astaci TaxID=112090 RepID=W4GEN7_APHAT|nr:hypothetical protein H257_08467 [Aphanomyces astaci]ETV77529.1 hypothetical protein H257_08467 [Aphanomyces astaci]|eukprot:XP_009832639.1 hypothetical protein H257_08467 [Aphanomyces astaci]
MQLDQWRLIVPVVMLVLNQSPSDTLGGVAPTIVMTGSRAMSPLDLISIPSAAKVTKLDDLLSWRSDGTAAMATALDKMHAKVLDASTSKRQKNRERRSKKKDAEIAQFDVGDFLLYVTCGRFHTMAWTSNRLKFYADDPLDVTEELLRRIAHSAEGHVVDQFLDFRYYDRLAAFEVCVRWRGLQEIEASWEPADNLLEDIPTEFKRYVRSNKVDAQVKAMATALGVTQSLGEIVANLPFAEPLNPSQDGIQVFD